LVKMKCQTALPPTLIYPQIATIHLSIFKPAAWHLILCNSILKATTNVYRRK
jgi:hypothetical protein